MGRRQDRWLARAAGLALQGLAAVAFLESHATSVGAQWPFAHPAFIGGVMLALAAFGIAHWSRDPAPHARRRSGGRVCETGAWLVALAVLDRFPVVAIRLPQRDRTHAAGCCKASRCRYSTPRRACTCTCSPGWAALSPCTISPCRRAQRPWPIAATPAYTVLPVMMISALIGVATLNHVFQSWGWISWPLALAMHAVMLRRLDAGRPQGWWPGCTRAESGCWCCWAATSWCSQSARPGCGRPPGPR